MASTTALRSRRSAAQLSALAGVERTIRVNDQNNRRKYFRDFSQAFRAYDSVLDSNHFSALITKSDILLIGDYHALPASQRFATSLIEQLTAQSERPIVLGVETIFARDQHVLDEWWYEEIEENELRERIRFDLDWGYDWEPVYELLETARQYADAAYGLDCMPREDLRKIGARDRHAADKVIEIRRAHPDVRIVVLFGESHLAPNHLPQLLREALPDERVVTVLQNVDALYWRAAGEERDSVEAVRVTDDVVCVFNTTPLEKYESYRLCLDRWSREDTGSPDLSPTIYNLISGLLSFLGIKMYSSHNTTQPRFLVDSLPEVYTRSSDSLLRKLLARKCLSESEKVALANRVDDRGCAYLPHVNAFYVREFVMVPAAEEVARFLYHACQGLPLCAKGSAAPGLSRVKEPEDLFYARSIENALAYFGSRVLNPARPSAREADLHELYDDTRQDIEQRTSFKFPEFIEMLDFLTLHRGFEVRSARYPQTPDLILKGRNFTDEKLEFVTRQLGYMLGSDLYDAYLEGRVTRRFVKDLFLLHLDEPGSAEKAYFALVRKLRPRPRRAVAK